MSENQQDSSVDYSDSRFGNCFGRSGREGITALDRNDYYNMENPNRGLCVIINNKKFHKDTNMSERTGTDVDAAALEKMFNNYGFEIILRHDQTVEEMTGLIRGVAKQDHMNSDSFILAVLSHGENEIVYGYDGTINIDDLLYPLKECKSLVGKPKFILIQACRGTNLDEGSDVAFDGKDDDVVSKIPIEADYLYAYSTVPGYYAWRNSQKGSWFVQALVNVFERDCTKGYDILKLLTRVNREVAFDFQSNASSMAMNRKKQVPYIAHTLTKDFYLTMK